MHVAERAEIDTAEQLVGADVIRVLGDLVLSRGDGFADSAEGEVEFGEAVLQHAGLGVYAQGELVFFDSLGRVVLAAVGGGHFGVHLGEAVVVVG